MKNLTKVFRWWTMSLVVEMTGFGRTSGHPQISCVQMTGEFNYSVVILHYSERGVKARVKDLEEDSIIKNT